MFPKLAHIVTQNNADKKKYSTAASKVPANLSASAQRNRAFRG
jgi:hypothetical protein